ncbi:type II toxin-antitoxin system RelE/ParE family toxin [Fortiea contorta]|uniref:type II toxin-antitoxin system RelE/ParE family toxin n=1 Tax=Fortiea contorta TaxID=1892405 RepID=UPI00047705D4|nr:type II toxin-antitoxin system RelE/ParE family toxin [Fortiea contorta]
MEAQPREIKNYITEQGKEPFANWLDSLRDNRAIDKIEKRLTRVQSGNLGDYKSVGEGVFELRIQYGPGYRVYFGQDGNLIILLLCGGIKNTQDEDIGKAKEYWRDYERSQNPKK